MPIWTPSIRSVTTIAPAVTRKTTASGRLTRQSTRSIRTSIIRNATAVSTPARAASGIRATMPPRKSIEASRINAWTIAERRLGAPAWMFVADRAMTPVTGMPPNSAEATLPSPWPTSS